METKEVTWDQTKGKRSILFVGPIGFRPGVWETRVAYIFPDIFEAVPKQFKIHMLTGPPPDFAMGSLKELCRKYDVVWHEIRPKPQKVSLKNHWKDEILFISKEIKPAIITNIFGAVFLGKLMGAAGKDVGARVILRVAGDEIGSRIPMGVYDSNIEKLDWDMASQSVGFQMADTIIVISPLEKERVCNELPESEWEKVLVCMRGVDTARFPAVNRKFESKQVERFLYVGRKSLEKGFDILEEVADSLFEKNKQIQFAFAGTFEPLIEKNRDYIGWVDSDDLPEVFSKSDAFIMCSRTEGFPQAVAEAMAIGLPCILPEHLFGKIFVNGAEAILTSLDPKDISRAVLRLHADKDLASSLALKARAFAESKLDKKIWSKVYHDILLGIESNVPSPFCNPVSNSRECKYAIDDRQMKLCLLISPFCLSSWRVKEKLNRFIIEMTKRNYSFSVILPENKSQDLKVVKGVNFLSVENESFVCGTVQQLSPDLLILASGKKDRSKYYSITHEINIPLVILELCGSLSSDKNDDRFSSIESYYDVWMDEIFYSSAKLVFKTEDTNEFNSSKFLQQHIKAYPEIIFNKDENMKDKQESMSCSVTSYKLNELSMDLWKDLNRRRFDFIQDALLNSFNGSNTPNKSFFQQIELDREKALHAKRMRKKMVNNLAGK